MLIPRSVLDGIVNGSVSVVHRRWPRPRVRAGTRLRTAVGLVEIVSIDPVGTEGDKHVYRIAVRYAGEDPRIALRERATLDDAERRDVRARLARMDRSAARGPWTAMVLRLIQDHPAVRAADLADQIEWDKPTFKRQVRKLKELGLTESLNPGYRISPRGRTILADVEAGTPAPTSQREE